MSVLVSMHFIVLLNKNNLSCQLITNITKMANCWVTKTPFQMALLLILAIAVPFLIAMLILYILWGVMSPSSVSCVDVCASRNNAKIPTPNQIETITDNPKTTTTKKKPKRSVADHDLPIAAVLEKMYVDDNEEYIFKCPASILANRWVLTTEDCVQNVIYAVRIGSRFWSTGGSLSFVQKAVFLGKNTNTSLVLLQLETTGFGGVQIGRIENSKFIRSFYWNSQLTLPLNMRKKYEELISVDIVGPYKNANCSGLQQRENVSRFMATKVGECGSQWNGPMLNENNELIGIHLKNICEDVESVLYINLDLYRSQILDVINNNYM